MAVTVQQFIERLTDSGLLSADELSKFQDSLPPEKRPKDVQQLAQALIQHGKLTKYQAQAVYQGKGKSLVFGEYVVLDQIGEGGMGVVLKARHRRMKRTVAIKVLSSAAMKQAGAVERFHREVEAAAKLEHPNIVTAHDAGEHQGVHYLAMQYVDGKDLASIVRDRGPLPVPQAVECILQAARGLQYAHEQGIVHRDIKPGNLLLDTKGTVKILDMGIARIAGAEAALGGPERLTATGQVMGTCDYMSPEQALDSHLADHRTDIYALGCTLYRLLTGHPPYAGETLMQILLAHREAPIPSLSAARPDVPAELDAVFQRMVAKQPEDRYQSMAEVVAELETILGGLSGHSATAAAVKAESSSGALSRTLAFLQEERPVGTLTRQKKPVGAERTQPRAVIPTGDGPGPSRPSSVVRRPSSVVLAAGGLVLLLGMILTFTLRHGTLTVEIDEQLGKDVQVAVSQGGEKTQVADATSGWTLSLAAGKYDLAVEGGGDQFQLGSESIMVTRGGQVKVKVTLKPAPLAVAPFDPQQARKCQERWARQLSVPIETTNSIGMKLALIPPGEFEMGSPKELVEEEVKANAGDFFWRENLAGEGPRHRVRLTKAFYLAVTEVTQGEYEKVMGSNPSGFSVTGLHKDKVGGQDTKRFPVENVSWDDAVEFCRKLSERPEEKAAGRWYRLPSEAQWEYACRAGSVGLYGFSSGRSGVPREYEEKELSDYGWSSDNAGGTTHAVGGKRPNAWGLYDMHGNVWEWCQDWYDKGYYTNSPVDDPGGPPGGSSRVRRGGGFGYPATHCRSASRYDREQGGPNATNCNRGFRVSLVVADTAAERAKMSRTTETAQPSGGSAANKPSPAPPVPNPQSPIPLPAVGSLGGADGKWKLPPGAPPPAIAPFDAAKAKEHQQRWAKHLGVPVELTNSIGMKLVFIPPGEFEMGEGGGEHEEAVHKVAITRPFYFGKYEVTNEEWDAVMGKDLNPSTVKGPKNPVQNVSWEDCQVFLKKLGQKCGIAEGSCRLPTEAQWEYACRAGSTGSYCFGDSEAEHDDYGWYLKNSEKKTHPVGRKKPNPWGLYDIHGNVWEWCSDWYDQDYYKTSPTSDPTGPPFGSRRVYRGGSAVDGARDYRSARRNSDTPGRRDYYLGFRVSLVLADTAAERAKLSRTTEAAQPSGDSTANKPPPAPPAPNPQSPIPRSTVASLVGADGKWNLPPGAPPPAVAPFDATKAKEHQEGWAKHLGMPVEITNSIGMKLVLIPPGEFEMGSPTELIEEELKAQRLSYCKDHLPGEGPRHRVRITKPFYFGVYEVTQGEYERVMGKNPSACSATGRHKDRVAGQDTKRFPVEMVSWDDAVEFCTKLSDLPEEKAAGRTYLLPSEAQWEYACRAGSTGRFSYSSARNAIPKEHDEKALSDYGWFIGGQTTSAVGGKRPSAWGLYDTHGNVWEWCQDWYDKDYYANSPRDDPRGPLAGSRRVRRGGCWLDPAWDCRSAHRNSVEPGDHSDNLGFRVSQVLAEK